MAADLSAAELLRVESQGYTLRYGTATVAYVDTGGRHQVLSSIAPAPLAIDGSVARYAPAMAPYVVQYEVQGDRAKRSVILLAPLPAPDPVVFPDMECVYLAVHGPLEVPAGLIIQAEGQAFTDNLWTADSIRLMGEGGNLVMFLDRIWARTATDHPCAGRYRLVTDPLTGALQVYELLPYWWLRSLTAADYPVTVDPTVATSTVGTATAYGAQRRIVRFSSNGNLLMAVTVASNVKFYYSADGGNTWAALTVGGTVAASSSSNGCVAIALDEDDYVHMFYVFNTDDLNYRRGTPNAARTGITWSADTAIATGVEVTDKPAIVAHREGTGWMAHLAWARVSATPNSYVYWMPVTIASNGTVTAGGVTILQTFNAQSNDRNVGLAINRVTKDLHLSYPDSSAVYSKTITYSAGVWTPVAGNPIIFSSGGFDSTNGGNGGIVCADNGTRYACASSNTSPFPLKVARCLAGGAWTDISPAGINGLRPAITVDRATAKAWVVYRQAAAGGLAYVAYDGTNWGAEVVKDSTSTSEYPTVRENIDGNAVDMGSTIAANTALFYRVLLNQPPTKPTNITVPNFDATAVQRLTYLHNDPDLDAQTAQQLQFIRVDTGATVLDTGKLATANQYYDITANAMPQSKQIQVRVMTWDTSDAASPWSDYATFYTSAKPTAAITYPAADGATHNSGSITAQGTISDPETEGSSAWQWVLTTSADVVLWDGGKMLSVNPPVQTVGYTLANGGSYKLKLTGWDAKGVASAQTVRTFTVSFTPPAAPTIAAAPDSTGAVTQLTATVNHTPVTVTSVRLERTLDSGANVATIATVAPSGTTAVATDLSAPAGTVQYRAVAIGNNGAETAGVWQAATLSFENWRFIPPDGALPVSFAYNSQVTWRPEDDVQIPQTQSRYRREYRGSTFAVLADVTARFADTNGLTARAWRERAAEHARLGTVGYLKGPQGDVWKGTLRFVSGTPNDAFFQEDGRLSFRQTGVSP